MVNKPVPANPRRVILVNPTKYLGNLLIAGGLMQAYAAHCRQQGIELLIVLDASFQELCQDSFPETQLVFFPRRAINNAGLWKKIALYRRTLKTLRGFKANLAFNIEEDSATSHLTRLSGAAFTLGCSPARHRRGYDHVVPVQFERRPVGEEHRWYSFYEVFAALGMAQPPVSYVDLKLEESPALEEKLVRNGLAPDKALIALHAGATKTYKRWPLEHMAALAGKIHAAGTQPVLIGAGDSDARANQDIIALLATRNIPAPVNLCNELSPAELALFLRKCRAMVGNDSGPFHLGSALGIPGCVIWGPTNSAIWGPLGARSEMVTGSFACDPACNKGHCLHDHRCLKETTPEMVFSRLSTIM